MKKKLLIIVLLIIYSVSQIGFTKYFINFELVDNYSIMYQPFLILQEYSVTIELINIIIILAIILMLFMGVIRNDLYQVGMYSILRFRSKQIWLSKHMLKITVKLFVVVVGYVLVSIIVAYVTFKQVGNLSWIILIQQSILFYLVFLALTQIQIGMEIHMSETIANAVVLFIGFTMITVYPSLIDNGRNLIANLLFVNDISIIRSGVLEGNSGEKIFVLIVMNLICYIVNVTLIKRKDIY